MKNQENFKIESHAQYLRVMEEIQRYMTMEMDEESERRFDDIVTACAIWEDKVALDQQ